MMAEGGGFIPVGFNIASGTISENGDTFNIMLSGSKLYFRFSNGKRRVSLDLTPAIANAYKLAVEE